MIIKTLSLDLEQVKHLLEKDETCTYKDLIKNLKKFITLTSLLSLLCISNSTHNRYLKEDAPLPLKKYMELLLITYKELPNE